MKNAIGIDEVGRGPLAGPVCVAGCILYDVSILKKAPYRLRDSKKLSEKERLAWMELLVQWKQEGKCNFSSHFIHAQSIDKWGIRKALMLGVSRTLRVLRAHEKQTILLDGSLYAPTRYKKQKTLIKGDELVAVISLASIVAKVRRDTYMKKQAKYYPMYGFEYHVGYGTRVHYKALEQHGISNIHRSSYLKKWLISKKPYKSRLKMQ